MNGIGLRKKKGKGQLFRCNIVCWVIEIGDLACRRATGLSSSNISNPTRHRYPNLTFIKKYYIIYIENKDKEKTI